MKCPFCNDHEVRVRALRRNGEGRVSEDCYCRTCRTEYFISYVFNHVSDKDGKPLSEFTHEDIGS